VLVNGSVSVVDENEAAAAIKGESLTLVYNTGYAIRDIRVRGSLALNAPDAAE
jgi:hypothetical protein